ncbi:MAG: hypothetical protein GY906_21700 [bacterium]|nr:hypothetical protein [bacterium]
MGNSTRSHLSRLSVVFLMLLAACIGGEDATETTGADLSNGADATLLRLAVSDPLPHLDPFLQNTAASNWMLYGNVFEGLIRFVGGEPQACLATAWNQEDDRTWVFTIKNDVTFHNGSSLTIEDVVGSFERILNHPQSAISGRVANIEGVAKRDANNVEVHLVSPSQTFLRGIAMVPIVAGASIAEPLDPLIATGPYRVVSYSEAKRLTLEKYDEYWGDEPQIDRAEFIFEGDEQTRTQLLLDGAVDIINQIPPSSIEPIEALPNLWVESSLGTAVRVLVIKNSVAPYSDPRVREAIDLAVDREALVEERYEGHARVAGQLADPDSVGHVAELAVPQRDLDRARELVAAVAQGNSIVLKLHCGSPAPAEAKTIKQQLEEAGFVVKLVDIEWSVLYTRIQAGEIPFVYQGWTNYSGDASSSFEELLYTYSPDGHLGKSNHGRYSNPEVDRLIDASLVTRDLELRRQLLESISKIVATDRPIIPLVRPLNLFGLRRSLDWVAPTTGALTLSQMTITRAEE